jgi:putative endonuclease
VAHYAYLLRCVDGTFYSGYTTDLQRRTAAHNSGRGAKYTRSRRPVVLVYYESFESKGEALKREAALKKRTHLQKQALADQFSRAESMGPSGSSEL